MKLTLAVEDLPNGEQLGVVSDGEDIINVQIKPPNHKCSDCQRWIGSREMCVGISDGRLICEGCWDLNPVP